MSKQEGPITATVRPTPSISIPYPISSNSTNSQFEDAVWTIPPLPITGCSENGLDNQQSEKSLKSKNIVKEKSESCTDNVETFIQNMENVKEHSSQLTAILPAPPPPPIIGPWCSNILRPLPSTCPIFIQNAQSLPASAFHTPPPALSPAFSSTTNSVSVVRPPPLPPTQPAFPSPNLSCIVPPPPLTYLTDISTPSTSTKSTTVSNVGGSDTEVACTDIFPSPPMAEFESMVLVRSEAVLPLNQHVLKPSTAKTLPCQPDGSANSQPKQILSSGVSPGGVSRVSSGSGSSIRETVLCNACGQMHDPHFAHVYDYSDSVDADLLCRICRQPLVDPIDTRCGHTFCTPCLKSHLVVQALCPEDKQIINYLECQQSSNLVKRLLDKLLVICPNSEQCEEVLSRCDLESHLSYWCRGTVVPCINAKLGCQFRAARALQTDHRRECRFQIKVSTSALDVVHAGQVARSAHKSVVRFGPMPARREQQPLLSVVQSDVFSSHEGSRSALPGVVRKHSKNNRVASPIRDCEVTTIQFPWKSHESLGISFIGGSDTPLLCIVIQEIYLDGVVAIDGRLRPGDQILEANGIDLTQATHYEARMAMTSMSGSRICELTVYRERANSETGSLKSDKEVNTDGPSNPFERIEVLRITLLKRLDKRLGIKLVGKKNLPGLYILGLVPDSEADLDGRLHKDDRILEINEVDLREGTQEEAANIIRTAEEHVALVVARIIRPQTPDIIRTASGEIVMDYNTHCTPNSPMVLPISQPSVNVNSIVPPSLKMSTTSLCREQVLVISKLPGESLGMSVAGGVDSQRGDTPVYVTNLDPNGVVGRMHKLAKGDVLLAVNEFELLGLSHERAVEALKATRKSCSTVTIRLLEGPETSSSKGNFLPSWLYWLQLPRYCQIPRTISLSRTVNCSLGFSIVGGNNSITDPNSPQCNSNSQNLATTVSSSSISSSPQPIVVKSIVPGTQAHRDGRLKCGDLILAVNQYSLTDVSHSHAVAILKSCIGDVHIRVVSWPGTIV